MSASILVTYTTRYGSTQEVAETISSTLREGDLEVDLQPMHNVKSLDPYRLVVFGAPIYIGHWSKEAHQFLSRFGDEIAQREIAIFALGPIQHDEKEWEGVRSQLDQELKKYPWLHPISLALFGGKYDPAKLRFPDSLLAKFPATPLHDLPASDARDWDSIRSWANGLNLFVKERP
jgi:menaquinone-dependent protoporphyrinogen oxidase